MRGENYDYKENVAYFATHCGNGVANDSGQCFFFPIYGHGKRKSHGKPCAYRGKCKGKLALDEL